MTIIEIQSELDAINKRRDELMRLMEDAVSNVSNSAINEAASECPNKEISPHIIIVRASDLMGKPWNVEYHNWYGGAKVLIEYLSKYKSEKWVELLKDMYKNRKENDRIQVKIPYSVPFVHYGSTMISADFVKRILDKLDKEYTN